MIRFNLIVFLTFLLLCVPGVTQNYEFGNVTQQELASKSDTQFPEANAVVLFRHVNTYLGNYVEVYERIKIFNEEGYDYATVRIPYRDVSKVKGATYNLVNGQVVKTELDKDLIFTDEVVKGIDIKKFTFPNVSPGAVLELSYKSSSGTMSDIDLQYDIPIKNILVKVTNRSQSQTEIVQNPRAFLMVNRKETGKSTVISAKNVPALEHEDHVYDMDMYRSYLKINLISLTNNFQFGNWDELVGLMMDINDFSYAFKPKTAYKKDLQALLAGETDPVKKTKLIYDYVRENIKWDETYGVMPDQSMKDVYKKREGSMADINALFISMLNSVDIEANPVLVSTKLNGIPLTASLSAFNGIIAGVELNGEIKLFDVVGDQSSFDLLDQSLLNWQGIYIYRSEKSFDWVPLVSDKASVRNVVANIQIDDELTVSGKGRERNIGYYAAGRNYQLKDLGANEVEDLLSYDTEGLELIDVKATKKDTETNIDFEFELEDAVDEIDGKLYFSPLFFLSLAENPFKKEERQYPIDFGYAFKSQKMINVKIPAGYKVESVPKISKVVLPEDGGSFVYRISAKGDMVQVSTSFEIKQPILPSDQYLYVKEFFSTRMSKENEQVVLSKI